MNSLKAKIEILKVVVGSAPPSNLNKCKEIVAKWAGIRAKINEAYNAGLQQIDGLTYGTLGQLWTFEKWNEQNGNPFPPEIFKFDLSGNPPKPYVTTNKYPPATAVQNPQLAAPEAQNDPFLKQKEDLVKCIKILRKCALRRGYTDKKSGKYIRGKSDMLYAAAVGEAIELARGACEPYISAGGMKGANNSQRRDFFNKQMKSFEDGMKSALGPACEPCVKEVATKAPAETAPVRP
jgi:hypothetical protein